MIKRAFPRGVDYRKARGGMIGLVVEQYEKTGNKCFLFNPLEGTFEGGFPSQKEALEYMKQSGIRMIMQDIYKIYEQNVLIF